MESNFYGRLYEMKDLCSYFVARYIGPDNICRETLFSIILNVGVSLLMRMYKNRQQYV